MEITAFLTTLYSQVDNTYMLSTLKCFLLKYPKIWWYFHTKQGLTKYKHIKPSHNQCMPQVISIVCTIMRQENHYSNIF